MELSFKHFSIGAHLVCDTHQNEMLNAEKVKMQNTQSSTCYQWYMIIWYFSTIYAVPPNSVIYSFYSAAPDMTNTCATNGSKFIVNLIFELCVQTAIVAVVKRVSNKMSAKIA